MATLGTGAACCGDPENCPIGVCGPDAVDVPLPSLAELDELNELDDEEEDDE